MCVATPTFAGFMYTYIYIYVCTCLCAYMCVDTGWRRLIGCLKLKVIFRKRATNYRALLWKMTFEDEASYDSMPPCISHLCWMYVYIHIYIYIYIYIYQVSLHVYVCR